MAVECPTCRASNMALATDQLWSACHDCGSMIFSKSGMPVVIAHESDAISEELGKALLDGGYTPYRAENGVQAEELIRKHGVSVAVLDVGLRDKLAYQIVDECRSDPQYESTKFILIASVYSKTAYKRSPNSLYGADDYVEQHHIPDMLCEKIQRLVGKPQDEAAIENLEGRKEAIRIGEERQELEGGQRVVVLAHSIVADIALYNQSEVEKVAQGELSKALESALEEGRRILRETVDQSSFPTEDPIGDAFKSFINDIR